MWLWVGIAFIIGLIVGGIVGTGAVAIIATSHIKNLEHIIEVMGEELMKRYPRQRM